MGDPFSLTGVLVNVGVSALVGAALVAAWLWWMRRHP